MKPNLGYYVQKINDIVKKTETIGENMHSGYEEVRKAIDEDQLTTVSLERRQEISELFKEGTQQYQTMLETIQNLRPPARVMGIHKKFEHAYIEYIAGCQAMIDSLVDGIDPDAFNQAEEKQDQATEVISFSIQRMTNLLLKR